jgi:hypothetical protein
MDDFANVTWQSDHAARDPESSVGSPGAGIEDQENISSRRHTEGPLGTHADAMDLAGVGEGVLECTVTSPLKENDGSKDAYVSYLVTTNVGLLTQAGTITDRPRQPSPPSRNHTHQSADALQISYSSTRCYRKNTQHVRYRRCRISIRWSMCGVIGLGRISHLDGLTRSIDFLRGWHCILC